MNAPQSAALAERALHILDEGGTAPLALIPVEDQPMTVATPRGVTPADLLQIAMQSGDKDIDRLERLMKMVLEDRQRDAMLAFREDFARFTGENIIIPKTLFVERGKAGSFEQAEYDRVCGMLSPALSKHGFGYRHDQKFTSKPWTTDGVTSDIPWVIVTCFLEHRKGHTEIVTLEGPPGDLTANTPVQNMQTTATYCKRQSLLAVTGTPTGGEDKEADLRTRAAENASQDQVEQAAARESSIQDKFKAAKTIPELSRVMNALSMGEKRNWQSAFNARRDELKRGAQ